MNPSQSPQWRELQQHKIRLGAKPLAALFDAEPQRAQHWLHEAAGVRVDLSRNLIDAPALASLLSLVRAMQLEDWRARLLAGEPVNHTEARPAWHTALRTPPADAKVAASLASEREKFLVLAEQLRAGAIHGATGRPIETVICFGIGGSDLGPRLVTEALGSPSGPRLHFVANIDPVELDTALASADPETTLLVAISKSFTTLETLENVRAAMDWVRSRAPAIDPVRQLVAITSVPARAIEFGVAPDRVLTFPAWVGGRYSVWSACGFPIAVAHGRAQFEALLAGAAEMDAHFAAAPLERNLPVLLGLLGVWYIDFWGLRTRAIFPYAQRLRHLPGYLQQLEMESCGKGVDRDAGALAYDTSPVVWGEVGTTAQHSVFQFLHQGTHIAPVDFVTSAAFAESPVRRERLLYMNAQAQADALAFGDSVLGSAQAKPPYAATHGGRPSTFVTLRALDAHSLGALLALYEHRTFVQSVVWNINAFDQFGVEIGKQLLTQRLSQ
ncbi:MAG: glucose-6-phosphate isomerase [Gemmatimonadota bacterium]